MENLYNIFNFFGDIRFVSFIMLVALATRIVILWEFLTSWVFGKKIQAQKILIVLVLLGSIMIDISWIPKFCELLFFKTIDYRIVLFMARMSMAFFILQYQSLSILICKLTESNYKISIDQKIFSFISLLAILFFVFSAIFNFNCFTSLDRPWIEGFVIEFVLYYSLFIVLPYGMIVAIRKTNKKNISRIVKRQVSILIKFLVLPMLLSDIIYLYPFNIFFKRTPHSFFILGLSVLFLLIATLYCIRKIMGLRFLNMNNHVTEPKRFNFVNDFKNVIEQLSVATNFIELEEIIKKFFKNAFDVPEKRVKLFVRNFNESREAIHERFFTRVMGDKLGEFGLDNNGLGEGLNIEEIRGKFKFNEGFGVAHEDIDFAAGSFSDGGNFGDGQSLERENLKGCKVDETLRRYEYIDELLVFLEKSKVLITDEIEFTNFYEKDEIIQKAFNFMVEINADIFIPVFEKNKIIAYIVVERFARDEISGERAGKFYSDFERDQMLILLNYLSNVIKLFYSKNINILIAQTKELKEELYLRHQENNKYRESILSFLRHEKQQEIGIIFYKNEKFTFGNSIASQMLAVKLNSKVDNDVTKKLNNLVKQVIGYGQAQSCFMTNGIGQKIAVFAMLNIDKSSVILSVRYPEVYDVVKEKIEAVKIEAVKDPSKIDYLLYLETTEHGKLIEKLFPGDSQNIISYKIDFLKIALSKKAILLDVPDQDLLDVVQILHNVSLREDLHIIELKKPSTDLDVAVKLFGINNIFGLKESLEKPLLERLDAKGTLFIKNINYMELETQKYLAEFIKYGFFVEFRGDKKTFSDVRVVCSTNADLKLLVEKGTFSSELFEQLRSTSLQIPTLMLMPENDLDSIASGFVSQHRGQLVKKDDENFVELTEKDRRAILESKPVSFTELKNKIKNIMEDKDQQKNVHEVLQLTKSKDDYDAQVMEAIMLGRRALRDEKIMRFLWDKFENQNKIATLLGVNRSSINRRCKEFELMPSATNSDLNSNLPE